ncbi:beta-eliminating lyase-related protein [Niabella sp. W65]|nr:beta-eliminating lyase-related protein [Niabella sp. W65]MCH7363342.1 beta-eliminating lyase-related protein [Niabella sp. W65]ULT39267.1 beta-eliminating lyase-related protein [Niabella sp. I65]
MRQVGYMAAAGIYALQHHIERLSEDHAHAKTIGAALQTQSYVERVMPVETNIVIFETKGISAKDLVAKLKDHHILAYAIAPTKVRLVLHLDITRRW